MDIDDICKEDIWIFLLRLLQPGLLAYIFLAYIVGKYCWYILLASIYFNLVCRHIGFGAIDLVPQFASLDRRGKLSLHYSLANCLLCLLKCKCKFVICHKRSSPTFLKLAPGSLSDTNRFTRHHLAKEISP